MNQCVIQPGNVWSGQKRHAHQLQIYVPETCQSESEKVRNLRAQLRELEQQMQEVDRLYDRLELLSKAELVTAIIMETSIGFLDLAAAIFAPFNKGAAAAAKSGLTGIRTTKALGEYHTGQINGAQLTTELTSQSLNVVKPKGLTGKVMLQQAKMHVDAVSIVVNASSGTSREQLAGQSADFVKSQALGNVELAGEALGEASKTARVARGLSLLDGVYTAAMSYGDALDARFDTRLDQSMQARQMLQSQKMMLKNLMARIRTLLEQATQEMEACTLQQTRQG